MTEVDELLMNGKLKEAMAVMRWLLCRSKKDFQIDHIRMWQILRNVHLNYLRQIPSNGND